MLLLPAIASAEIQDIVSSNRQFGVQAQLKHVTQTETAAGATLATENGHIGGYGLSASAMTDLWLGRDYIDAQFGLFYGDTNYVGGTLANPAYGSVTGRSGAQIADYSVRYGKGFALADDDFMITPYAELGRHIWDRTIGYDTPGRYVETYSHSYYGIGAMAQYVLASRTVLSVDALIGRTFWSNIVVYLPAPYAGFSAGLRNSMLNRIGVSVDYAVTKALHANAGVRFTTWNYGASGTHPIGQGGYAYEPDSKTDDTTVKAGLGLAF